MKIYYFSVFQGNTPANTELMYSTLFWPLAMLWCHTSHLIIAMVNNNDDINIIISSHLYLCCWNGIDTCKYYY